MNEYNEMSSVQARGIAPSMSPEDPQGLPQDGTQTPQGTPVFTHPVGLGPMPQAPKAPYVPRSPYVALAALISYPIAYFYTRVVFEEALIQGRYCWSVLVFGLLFVAATEAAARIYKRALRPECYLYGAAFLVQCLGFALWGAHTAVIGDWQILMLHGFAIYYAMVRTGALTAGRSGCLVGLDVFGGVFFLPAVHIGERFLAFRDWIKARRDPGRRLTRSKVLWGLLTAAAAVIILSIVMAELGQADANFKLLSDKVADWWEKILDGEWFGYFIFSIPVGIWLFGLIFGGARRGKNMLDEEGFAGIMAPLRRVPWYSGSVIMILMVAVYAVFFALQFVEFVVLRRGLVTFLAPWDAARFAVDGFWSLCRILLLNLTVLSGFAFLGEEGSFQRKAVKIPAALVAISGLLFAVLDAAKLYTYVHLYGYTPRRVLSGWFLFVLAVCAVLAIVRVFKRFPAFPAAIAVFAISFSLLVAFDVDQGIIDANFRRYARGTDKVLDLHVLDECGVMEERVVRRNMARLISSGYFTRQEVEIDDLFPLVGYCHSKVEIEGDPYPREMMYYRLAHGEEYQSFTGSVIIDLGDGYSKLILKAEDGIIRGASLQ